jgi:hypothetical protein
METLIQEILALSGPLPDAVAHQRYLETLSLEQLRERRAALNDMKEEYQPA